MEDAIKHGPLGWFATIVMGGIALWVYFHRQRIAVRKEESQAELDTRQARERADRNTREAADKAAVERRRATQQERADDISREVNRVMEGYKEYLASEKRRHDTDRKVNSEQLRTPGGKLEAVQTREQECREEQARQDEQIKHLTDQNARQQDQIERNTTELETLKDMLPMHGIRLRSGPYPAVPPDGSGPHRALPAAPGDAEKAEG